MSKLPCLHLAFPQWIMNTNYCHLPVWSVFTCLLLAQTNTEQQSGRSSLMLAVSPLRDSRAVCVASHVIHIIFILLITQAIPSALSLKVAFLSYARKISPTCKKTDASDFSYSSHLFRVFFLNGALLSRKLHYRGWILSKWLMCIC